MPSLRRSMSSPVVRSSPYPATIAAPSGAAFARTSGGGHRRSSGSETISRRVLADIEWWRVAEGQHFYPDLRENVHEDILQDLDEVVDEILGAVGIDVSRRGAERRDSAAPPPYSPVSSETVVLQENPAPALAVLPQTPMRRRHVLESSTSSLESTPEAPEVFIEGISLDMDYLNLDVPSLALSKDKPEVLHVSMPSFADYLAILQDDVPGYADFALSPLSSLTHILN